jgi:predicted esterase YcpF (UPF0227 family)
MSATAQALPPPSRALFLLEARAIQEFGAFLGALPLLGFAPRGDGHPVLVLPGLIASDMSTRPLRTVLDNCGYAVEGWNQGRNLGLRPGVEDAMLDQVRRMTEKHGRKVSVIGWSLGGIYARQVAKLLPDHVRSVITMGSPFAAHPHSTNAWRVYEYASGQRAIDAHVHHDAPIAAPPPVPSTAIYSRTDGICAWQGCMEKVSPIAENIEVDGSHCGLGHHPAVIFAVADRLAQPEGQWKPFERRGWRSLLYLDPDRD